MVTHFGQHPLFQEVPLAQLVSAGTGPCWESLGGSWAGYWGSLGVTGGSRAVSGCHWELTGGSLGVTGGHGGSWGSLGVTGSSWRAHRVSRGSSWGAHCVTGGSLGAHWVLLGAAGCHWGSWGLVSLSPPGQRPHRGLPGHGHRGGAQGAAGGAPHLPRRLPPPAGPGGGHLRGPPAPPGGGCPPNCGIKPPLCPRAGPRCVPRVVPVLVPVSPRPQTPPWRVGGGCPGLLDPLPCHSSCLSFPGGC